MSTTISSSSTSLSSMSSSSTSNRSSALTSSSSSTNSSANSSSASLANLGNNGGSPTAPTTPSTDIRITYVSDEGTPLDGGPLSPQVKTAAAGSLNRPEAIGPGIHRHANHSYLLERDGGLGGSAASSPVSLSSPSSSDCLSGCGGGHGLSLGHSLGHLGSHSSLNSPGSRCGSPKPLLGPNSQCLQPSTLAIHGLRFAEQNNAYNFNTYNFNHLSISRASSMDEGIFPSPLNSPIRSTPSSPMGPKFKIIHEGDIHLCRLNHQRTVISKILSSKFLRRWESHKLYLTSVNIASKTPIGFMEVPIPYSQIEDVYSVSRWDSSQKFYIRAVIPDGSVLLQLPNKWVRDQWLNSINWKRCMLKFQRILVNSSIRHEVLVKELKNLIDLTLTTPLQDECIYQTSLDIINELLQIRLKDFERKSENASVEMQMSAKKLNEAIIVELAPLLEKTSPTLEICLFLSKHCRAYPRSMVITEYYSEIVQRILKHNMDYSKNPRTRVLVQDYFLALQQQNEGGSLVEHFIRVVHGFGSTCPHPRVINNIVSVCLASMYSLFEKGKVESMTDDKHEKKDKKDKDRHAQPKTSEQEEEWQQHLECFINIFTIISLFDDWRPLLAQILQPIPFPEMTLVDARFRIPFKSVIMNISLDTRCDVHQMLLAMREGKESWLDLYSPTNKACDDEGLFWSSMLKGLLDCCCRRKRFYVKHLLGTKCGLDACLLRALRDDATCQQVLCDLLEMELVESELQQQIISTLLTTSGGQAVYEDLCQRQYHLKEIQQSGGPQKLTLPSRSTDADLVKLLGSGSFGNLESLSLAFTHVTSDCAPYLIQLPSLRSLNLWSTQFSDKGLLLISEHLPDLEVLNLCETPVTDKGIDNLISLKRLQSLNLNSTHLSAAMYEKLKANLPALREIDVRYTDAW